MDRLGPIPSLPTWADPSCIGPETSLDVYSVAWIPARHKCLVSAVSWFPVGRSKCRMELRYRSGCFRDPPSLVRSRAYVGPPLRRQQNNHPLGSRAPEVGGLKYGSMGDYCPSIQSGDRHSSGPMDVRSIKCNATAEAPNSTASQTPYELKLTAFLVGITIKPDRGYKHFFGLQGRIPSAAWPKRGVDPVFLRRWRQLLRESTAPAKEPLSPTCTHMLLFYRVTSSPPAFAHPPRTPPNISLAVPGSSLPTRRDRVVLRSLSIGSSSSRCARRYPLNRGPHRPIQSLTTSIEPSSACPGRVLDNTP